MAISKVQAFTQAGSVSGTSDTVSITANTTAGNVMVVMAALTGGHVLSSVTDSRGNTYAVHYIAGAASSVGMSVASARLTTALLNGDTITMNSSVASIFGAVAQEYVGMDPVNRFRTKATDGQAALASAAADGGATLAASASGDLVLGVFGTNSAANILTPGAGYADEAGVATTGTVVTLDWESKKTGGSGTEDATATLSVAADWAGGTVVFAAASARAVSVPMVPSIPTLGRRR